jgi:hypothetical protein
VQDGDCLESIAARYGHNWQTIWNHPRNAAVKAARKSPNILFTGPAAYPSSVARGGLRHRQVAQVSSFLLTPPPRILGELALSAGPAASRLNATNAHCATRYHHVIPPD